MPNIVFMIIKVTAYVVKMPGCSHLLREDSIGSTRVCGDVCVWPVCMCMCVRWMYKAILVEE